MENLNIQGTEDTLSIVFNSEAKTLEISGNSIPYDAKEFFDPLIDWLSHFAQSDQDAIEVVIKIQYINTISKKYFFNIFSKINLAYSMGKSVKIIWLYEEDDTEIQDLGKDYAEYIDVPFEFKEYL
ncbi:DUF1987 domain-containing protein [bacterium AH-315-C07]|nr:DUF1987 domain-containing protein [bacterium AH-315-C07]